jgi:CheY-like chemotaxis protein
MNLYFSARMAGPRTLHGRRVLVVEDEVMIAMALEDVLGDLGCVVIGPIHDLDAALDVAGGGEEIDAALLDINLAGQRVFPVADALRARGVPVIFGTGYVDIALRDIDKDTPILLKPYRPGEVARALGEALIEA